MMSHARLSEVRDWLEERKEEMVRFLARLARLESPTTDPQSQGPVFDAIGSALESIGWETRRLSGRLTGGQLHVRPKRLRASRRRGVGARRTPIQIIVGHVDTVWPLGTLQSMPVVRQDGRLRGPGVFDMKGGLAQAIFALRALDALGLEPEVMPVLFLNSDEETGSPESKNRVRHLSRRAVRALILEPGLEPSGKLKTTRRGGGSYRVRVRGKSAHTGLAPGEGASAIHELSHVIQALYQLSDPERDISVNVGEIRGGTRPNVVASEASAQVDVRVRTLEDGRWIDERLRALEALDPTTPGTTLTIEGSIERAPVEPTPRNRRLWHAAQEVGESLGLRLEEGMSGGGSDGNTTSLYTATLDGLGSVGDGAHAVHEYVEIDRMPERAALLAGMVMLPDLERSSQEASTGAATEPRRADS